MSIQPPEEKKKPYPSSSHLSERVVASLRAAKKTLAEIDERRLVRALEELDEPIHSPQWAEGSRSTSMSNPTHTAAQNRQACPELRDTGSAAEAILAACERVAAIYAAATSETPKQGQCQVCMQTRGRVQLLTSTGECATCKASGDKYIRRHPGADRNAWRRERRRKAEQQAADIAAAVRARQLRKAG